MIPQKVQFQNQFLQQACSPLQQRRAQKPNSESGASRATVPDGETGRHPLPVAAMRSGFPELSVFAKIFMAKCVKRAGALVGLSAFAVGRLMANKSHLRRNGHPKTIHSADTGVSKYHKPARPLWIAVVTQPTNAGFCGIGFRHRGRARSGNYCHRSRGTRVGGRPAGSFTGGGAGVSSTADGGQFVCGGSGKSGFGAVSRPARPVAARTR